MSQLAGRRVIDPILSTLIKIGLEYDDKVIGLKIKPLGGQDGIGAANCWLFEFEDQQLLFDCGRMILRDSFDDEDDDAQYYPDFSYINIPRLQGVVLSHGHFDHIYGLPKLVKMFQEKKKVLHLYATRTTFMVINRIMSLSKLVDWEYSVVYHLMEDAQPIGKFKVISFPVNHSIPESVGLVLQIKGKSVCYLTDFKYTGKSWDDLEKTERVFQEVGLLGINVLIIDTANAFVDEFTPSIDGVKNSFAELFQDPHVKNRRIIVTIFSSDIDILRGISYLANKVGNRPVRCVGSTMRWFDGILGIIQTNQSRFKGREVVFVTGCQAEPNSALALAVNDENPQLELKYSDVIVYSSRAIPSNRRAIDAQNHRLRRKGCEVILSEDGSFHSSGHGGVSDLNKAITDISPASVILCHSFEENRRLVESKLINRGVSLSKFIRLNNCEEHII